MDSDLKKYALAKEYLNYSDEELKQVASNPDYRVIMEKAAVLLGKEFVFEVEEAHGCACQHKPGQKITVSGDGSLLAAKSPERICVYLLNSLIPMVFAAQEFCYADMDPNSFRFKKVGCLDNKADCGGFGHVNVRFSSQAAT